MSTAAANTASSAKGSSFFRSRLGSALAVVPLSVWTVIHLWNNLAAFRGAKAWQSAVTDYGHPVSEFVTGFLVLTPLLIHTFWGIGRLYTSRPNNVGYGYFANFKYLLQRITALGVLAFLGAHLWLAMLKPRLIEGRPEPFADIAHEMHHHVPTQVVYLLGTLGVAYHLANGLHSFAMGWGLVSSRRALKRLEGAALALFFVLLAMSWGALYALYEAGA
jgi:succinate dehydrogenase / fumarate reductase, cytochrome b subunit